MSACVCPVVRHRSVFKPPPSSFRASLPRSHFYSRHFPLVVSAVITTIITLIFFIFICCHPTATTTNPFSLSLTFTFVISYNITLCPRGCLQFSRFCYLFFPHHRFGGGLYRDQAANWVVRFDLIWMTQMLVLVAIRFSFRFDLVALSNLCPTFTLAMFLSSRHRFDAGQFVVGNRS